MAGTVLIAMPALAGTVTINNGQVVWQSTQCAAPSSPSLGAPSAEMRANDMNARVAQYNTYANSAQSYMNCVSHEAQEDSSMLSQAVVTQAQALIASTQKSVEDFGSPLHLHLPKATALVAPAPAPSMTTVTTTTSTTSMAPAPNAAPVPAVSSATSMGSDSTSTFLMAPSAGMQMQPSTDMQPPPSADMQTPPSAAMSPSSK
jgi:hypothetical protein